MHLICGKTGVTEMEKRGIKRVVRLHSLTAEYSAGKDTWLLISHLCVTFRHKGCNQ